MGNEILKAYQSLNQRSISKTDVILNLKNVEKYLESLVTNRNNLKDPFVYRWTFSNFIKDKDISSYCRANILSATKSLSRFILKLENQELDAFACKYIKHFICDLKPFIIRMDPNQQFDWLVFHANSHITNHYYSLANHVFSSGLPGPDINEREVLASTSPFIIRQCIEYKIRGILGINYILVDNKPDLRLIEKCFHVITKNTHFYKTVNFDFEIIRKIYNWTHFFIHGGHRPEMWRTETAIFYLNNFFYSGLNKKSDSFSLYAAVQVNNSKRKELRQCTNDLIRQMVIGELYIDWLDTPEVMFVND